MQCAARHCAKAIIAGRAMRWGTTPSPPHLDTLLALTVQLSLLPLPLRLPLGFPLAGGVGGLQSLELHGTGGRTGG